jgi:hypothetical protein
MARCSRCKRGDESLIAFQLADEFEVRCAHILDTPINELAAYDAAQGSAPENWRLSACVLLGNHPLSVEVVNVQPVTETVGEAQR